VQQSVPGSVRYIDTLI